MNNNLPEDGRSQYGRSFSWDIRKIWIMQKFKQSFTPQLTTKVQEQQYASRHPQSARTTICEKIVEVLQKFKFIIQEKIVNEMTMDR